MASAVPDFDLEGYSSSEDNDFDAAAYLATIANPLPTSVAPPTRMALFIGAHVDPAAVLPNPAQIIPSPGMFLKDEPTPVTRIFEYEGEVIRTVTLGKSNLRNKELAAFIEKMITYPVHRVYITLTVEGGLNSEECEVAKLAVDLFGPEVCTLLVPDVPVFSREKLMTELPQHPYVADLMKQISNRVMFSNAITGFMQGGDAATCNFLLKRVKRDRLPILQDICDSKTSSTVRS
jgi:hypothetical protein